MSAVISPCGKYRYRLDRAIPGDGGLTYAFFGVNPSTADAEINDATVRKWLGFAQRWGAGHIIVGNAFAYRSTDVRALADVADPFGPDQGLHISRIIDEADILVPCWGSRDKVPKRLHFVLDNLDRMLRGSDKTVVHLGLTASGDPRHPLMLGYDTPITEWTNP